MSWQQEQESSPLFHPLRTFGAQGSHSQEVPEIVGGVWGALPESGGWNAGDQNLMHFSHQVMATAVAAAGKAQLWWGNQTFHLWGQHLSRVITYAGLPATIPVCASSPSHFFKIFFFWCGPFLKLWSNLLQYCFCFVLVFWLWSMWDLRSPTRDWTRTPYIGRQSLNHWTAREVLILVTNTTPFTCKIVPVWTINCMNPHQLPCLHTSKPIALNTKFVLFFFLGNEPKHFWKEVLEVFLL